MATEVTKAVKTAEEYAVDIIERRRGLFRSKEMRDQVVHILLNQGISTRRGSVRSQQLHPEYVTDYVGTYTTGFGNTDYQTHWSVLYEVRVTP
jgi:hypothetical protein